MMKITGKMKTAKEIYEDDKWGWDDYQPMLDSFGKIIIQIDDEYFHGDSRLIYEDNGKYGYLQFGWGSCSGCDALQACDDLNDVQELMDSLNDRIKWFDSLHELQLYFKEKDWSLEYSWKQEEQKKVYKSGY